MAGPFQLLSSIISKKWNESPQPESKRIDRDLPLGMRLGGMIQIPEVDFILYGDKLKMKPPATDLAVIGIGTFAIGKFAGYRFYLKTEGAEDFFMLQIMKTPGSPTIDDCKFFSLWDEIYPDGWDFWLGEDDGYIGYSAFDLQDSTRYFRVWENPQAQKTVQDDGKEHITHIPPVDFQETTNFDPWGNDTHYSNNESMLYGRELEGVTDGMTEFLLVSCVSEGDDASVQLYVGVPVAPSTIKIVF